ncbi:MAG TPA: hypothetical protein ENJ00_02355 [Phycisphaerales bacterium]|nr:hypothetical protein [Phycisphaerales bacterium]
MSAGRFTQSVRCGLVGIAVIGVAEVSTCGAAADPNDPAEFTVTQQVLQDAVEPIGVNLTKLSGGTNLATNNLIFDSGMEPAVARYLIRVEREGPGWIEWDESLGGVHMYEQNATGFGDGATVRLYRIVDAAGQPLSYAGGTDLSDATGADHVVFLGETTVPAGGWVAEGEAPSDTNRVSLADTSLQLAYGDYAIFTVKKTKILQSEVDPRLHQFFEPEVGILSVPAGAAADLVTHPGTIPPGFTDPGETCLKITATGPGAFAGQTLFHGIDSGEGLWYSQLEPGASYRAEVWLRQEGLANQGAVWFGADGPYASLTQQTPWTVTGQWQKFTYDFTGPAYPDASQAHAAIGLAFDGPGTLWIDNFVVYRDDAAHGFKPFTPNRLAFDEFMAAMPATGPKPAIRFFNETYFGHAPMDRLLSNYPSSHIDFIYNIQPAGAEGTQLITVPMALEWCLATDSSPANRSVPYITLSEEYTENDWLALAEYLGVPYDPAVDTPATKPWAYKRFVQRGTGTPWTNEFREIVIEFGNESWHQGLLAGWDGFGRYTWVHTGGREYGLFARHYFDTVLTAQPWWNQYNLGQKLHFSLNANYEADLNSITSYGELAAQAAPNVAHYIGHANYVGPTWETGDVPFQNFDDHGMQETLVGGITGMFPLIDSVEAAANQLRSQGLADYAPVAYEGGPSGYYLPGDGTAQQVAISQLYGKSLGMGVSALDTWLYSSLHGYSHQFLYSFLGGDNWTSHTMPRAGGFRQHSGWLALRLRNIATGSQMLDVTTQSVPTYARSGQQIPLTAAYAISDTNTMAVFVISRKLDGVHDGADFGDGTTPITIHLPFNSAAAVTRYALTSPDGSPADPRVNNIDATNIVISSVALDPAVIDTGDLVIGPNTGGVPGGMPPGTAYLYIFDLSASCPGDVNNDGLLNAADFTAWIAAFNAKTPECDQNNDGNCNPADFTTWIANFNTGCG